MGETDINEFITKVNDVLINHYNELKIVTQNMQEETSIEETTTTIKRIKIIGEK